jgi:hypothetical protein
LIQEAEADSAANPPRRPKFAAPLVGTTRRERVVASADPEIAAILDRLALLRQWIQLQARHRVWRMAVPGCKAFANSPGSPFIKDRCSASDKEIGRPNGPPAFPRGR